MIITPYSDPSLFASGGKCEASAANFPACKLFFKCNEAAGALSLADAITGGTLATSSALTKPDSASISAANGDVVTAGTTLVGGTVPVFSTGKYNLLVAVGLSYLASKLAIGDTTGAANVQAFISSPTTLPTVVDGAGHSISATGLTLAADSIFGIRWDTANVYSLEEKVDGATALTTNGPTALTGWVAPSTIANKMTINLATGAAPKLYGLAFFQFTSGFPANLTSALAWMGNQWKAGNKWVYPGWRNLT